MSDIQRVDVQHVLSSLKDFQRRSVDYVFDRLYGKMPTRRFLLADEVGLGKTMVARGVIAKVIDHLQSSGARRIDVVYICSNADIARQNISRLNVTGSEDFQLASRITLLPQTVKGLKENSINFISFTPTTSFKLGHSSGTGDERWLLYWLLKRTWPDLCSGTAAINLMQGSMGRDKFRSWIREYDPDEWIDRGLAAKFKEGLLAEDRNATAEIKYKTRFRDLCRRFSYSRKTVPEQDRWDRNAFIGELRALLAATCIDALDPALIVLDEFQRFKDLLDPENPAGSLARHLFRSRNARVLLVSATPYKMYTLSQESEVDDHYKDFINTLSFLIDDGDKTTFVKQLLAEYGRACSRIVPDGVEPFRSVKRRVESELRQIMCRTEKLAVTEDRSGMLREVSVASMQISTNQICRYQEIRQIANTLEHGDVLEYWKASPFLLNFMESDQYRLKKLFRAAVEADAGAVGETLKRLPRSVLNAASWRVYKKIDACHALLERLAVQTVGSGWWRLLWIPPAFPYYELAGPFADVGTTVTKRLVFSAWQVVPKAISVLLSYEAERQMIKSLDSTAINTKSARERRRALLTFTRSEGRLTGMPALSMLYPSMTLAKRGDPQAFRTATQSTLAAVLQTVAARLRKDLAGLLTRARKSGPADEAWYWAAPILLDRLHDEGATEAWFVDTVELARRWSGATDEAKGWLEHVEHGAEVAFGTVIPEGRPPEDLADVLALLAVGGPANCALRSLAHTLRGGIDLYHDRDIRVTAGRMSWGIRSLFNTPEVIALVRGMNAEEPYWRRVLEYCAKGCLQSVLDEYLHVLVESEGLVDKSASNAAKERFEAAMKLSECVASVAGLRAQTPGVDWIGSNAAAGLQIENHRVRGRFAMRFGDESGEEETGIRKDAVRAAFNSPFWPFVLATTSVGQEGLDFHPYCHAVMHWNLPSNPVDMEQREGRVHRYKGHAVRKNVAMHAQRSLLNPEPGANAWKELFAHAAEQTAGQSDITPYWVFQIDGGAFIERHAPVLPLSREATRLPALRRSMAIYRMVFGQPRQEDLIEHLKRTVPDDELSALSHEMRIDLEPPDDLS